MSGGGRRRLADVVFVVTSPATRHTSSHPFGGWSKRQKSHNMHFCFFIYNPQYHMNEGGSTEDPMTSAKIQVSIGAITFSGEGTEEWLEKQLDKLLASAPTLAAIHPPPDGVENSGSGNDSPDSSIGPLPTYLQKCGNTTNQVRRFLATAEWLHKKGKNRVKTGDVVKALSDANQKRLGNASECLNKNVAKGHCEKDGDGFFVTPEGRSSLG